MHSACRASHEAVAHTLRVKASFIFLAHRVRLDLSLPKIRFYFQWSTQILNGHVNMNFARIFISK